MRRHGEGRRGEGRHGVRVASPQGEGRGEKEELFRHRVPVSPRPRVTFLRITASPRLFCPPAYCPNHHFQIFGTL
ncbi:MAG TPA: hypothetical protein VK203_04005 [Nostocaceae cyanobacterium]|nr:hypothetical protein [Nostocaceae cyanobacterium]